MATREGINLEQTIEVHELNGKRQIHRALLAGTLSTGNIAWTVGVTGVTGTPVSVNAAVLTGDTLAQGAVKSAAALNANAALADKVEFVAIGDYVYMQARDPGTFAAFNMAFTGGGTTPDATSELVQTGVASTVTPPRVWTLSGLMIKLADAITTKQYQAQGWKIKTSNIINQHYSTGTFSGPASYVEMALVLAGLLPYTIAESPSDVFTWSFLPNAQGPDDQLLFEYKCGDDYQVETYPEMCFSSLNINWGLEEVTIDGNVFSKAYNTTDVTLYDSAVQFNERLVSSGDVDVFCDSTYGAIGTTKLPNAFDAKLSISDKWKQKWTLNSANEKSYADTYEEPVDIVLTLLVEADAQGIALREALLNGEGRYIRLNSESEQLITGTATPYEFTGDLFVKLRDIQPQKDYQGSIYAYDFQLGVEHSVDMGRGYRFELVTGLEVL